ncbi:toll-like receptor 6 [Phascolarctos cinereus]|uniref:Toll-like receptor n=1 Tax=Phascolarctos cinereus TaxID=38626 RepID=A0A6P5KRH6_PHACI|nr:toll-like receptor 6 [Phascolarctos cinereus]XP_020847475.1 toll-like receptor 6 [Phascolarctos cinereus]XP_020847482.1 toll-like receptor 6 [Phascolarctos cinereus]
MTVTLKDVQCNSMANPRPPFIRTFHFLHIFMLILGNRIQHSLENEFVVNYSNNFLSHVPRLLSSKITVLDLSLNNITGLQIEDFKPLPKLRVLKLSHNRIQHLDINVFKFNQDLQYLDLSHNKLWRISCYPLMNLTYLDLSFNEFEALPICEEFANMSQLDFLGLSATRIQKSDLLPIHHLNLSNILLDLQRFYGKKDKLESLPILSTKILQIIFPPNRAFSVQLDMSVSNLRSLELTNINLDNDKCSIFNGFVSKLINNLRFLNLTLYHIETTWKCFVEILQFLWDKPTEYLSIYNLTLVETIDYEPFSYYETSLKGLKIELLSVKVYIFSQTSLYRIFSNMNIKMLTLSNTQMLHMLCPPKPSPFQYLDFSNSLFTESLFQDCRNLNLLQTLILQKNKFKHLYKIAQMTEKMESLKHLDLSQNSIRYDNRGNCSWTESLLVLNLSSNELTDSVFRCLPPNITVLDLCRNNIRSIPKDMSNLETLQELNIAFNSLADLPGCSTFSSLSILIIRSNSVSRPTTNFFNSCQNIKLLQAGDNPFLCNCELREFSKNIATLSNKVVSGWPHLYKCAFPDSYKGIQLKDFHLSPFSCSLVLLVITVVIIGSVLMIVTTFLCIRFDLPWYLRMIFQWTQTRRRARNIPIDKLERTFQFHAFISYSELDSAWVKHELLPNLDDEDIKICLHERNFVPGKSIVENIINCIEKSYKSIFILSPNFIQSEWCHYELYFAHHKLFHEGSDNLILILLEPIPSCSIPARYHKLKALMAQRTYLEWHKEKSKQVLFWANIKAAFNMKLALVKEGNDI